MKTYMDYGQALKVLEAGGIVTRPGWNGNNMFIFMQVGNKVPKAFIPNFKSLPDKVKKILEEKDEDVVFNQSITMYTAQGTMQPGWHPSQPDMFATDWIEIE